ncbi:quinol oxidase [Candidatus Acidianus copahuensis]|uniref:Quinol oxidase n=1 Tax=Candidatus Acidianus copahuensis TaxID=1160895 RepID=A0A031LTV5_9CREN|nr:quinol oxidase [Candidatus Acidianus copahuensis]EZQ10563.1 quinol oxidase [Candidatus Acidianus copahuensis]
MKRSTVIALFLVLVVVAVISLEVQYDSYDYVGYNPTNNAGVGVVHASFANALGAYKGPYVVIYVTGQQWHWDFYPHDRTYTNLTVVPVDEPVVFVVHSVDVFHEFFVQSATSNFSLFNYGAEAVPGYYSYIVLVFPKPGIYHVACAEYCGTATTGLGHSWLVGTIVATTNATYASEITGGVMPEGTWAPNSVSGQGVGGY